MNTNERNHRNAFQIELQKEFHILEDVKICLTQSEHWNDA